VQSGSPGVSPRGVIAASKLVPPHDVAPAFRLKINGHCAILEQQQVRGIRWFWFFHPVTKRHNASSTGGPFLAWITCELCILDVVTGLGDSRSSEVLPKLLLSHFPPPCLIFQSHSRPKTGVNVNVDACVHAQRIHLVTEQRVH
jgi:hypothetical protein